MASVVICTRKMCSATRLKRVDKGRGTRIVFNLKLPAIVRAFGYTKFGIRPKGDGKFEGGKRTGRRRAYFSLKRIPYTRASFVTMPIPTTLFSRNVSKLVLIIRAGRNEQKKLIASQPERVSRPGTTAGQLRIIYDTRPPIGERTRNECWPCL